MCFLQLWVKVKHNVDLPIGKTQSVTSVRDRVILVIATTQAADKKVPFVHPLFFWHPFQVSFQNLEMGY